jgi:hypothetical protein
MSEGENSINSHLFIMSKVKFAPLPKIGFCDRSMRKLFTLSDTLCSTHLCTHSNIRMDAICQEMIKS